MEGGLVEVSLGRLKESGLGPVDDALMYQVEKVSEDILHRMGNLKDRKVTMNILFTPVVDDMGIVRDVCLTFHVFSNLPKGVAQEVRCKLDPKKGLLGPGPLFEAGNES